MGQLKMSFFGPVRTPQPLMKPVTIYDVMAMKPGQSLPCRHHRAARELAFRANRKTALSRGMSRLPVKEFWSARDDNGVARVWRRA